MLKSDLKIGTELIEKKSRPHTNKLQVISIVQILFSCNYVTGKNQTKYLVRTKEGTFYPASNYPNCVLDGLIGDRTLLELKRNYTIKEA